MTDLNRVMLLGNIGNEIELKKTFEGKPYLKLSIATNVYGGPERQITDWHRVMVFGAQADVCATYLRKGSRVLVEGSLGKRTWLDKETQKNVSQVSVIASRVIFLSSPDRRTEVFHPAQPIQEEPTTRETNFNESLAESA